MNTLQRYVMRELLLAVGGGVLLFAFVLLLGNAIQDLVGLLADGKLPPGTFILMLVMLIPFALSFAMPMGLITGIMLTLGRLSAQHEVTAMRTAGVSIMRVTAPVLALAIVGVAMSLVINLIYAPNAKKVYERMLADAIRTNPLSFIQEKTFIRQFPGKVLYVGTRNRNTLRDFWVWEIDDESRVTNMIRAEEGYFEWNEEDNYMLLVLRNGETVVNDPDEPENFTKFRPPISFERASIQFPLDEIFRKAKFDDTKPSWMNIKELVQERRRLIDSEKAADIERRMWVEMQIHEKGALAFSILSLALVGIPLAIKTGRSETSANLGLALLLTMGFYLIMTTAKWFEDRPDLYPQLLLWTPNFVYQILAFFLWRRMGRT